MSQAFISAGWTIDMAREPDEEQVKQFIDRLSTEQVLSQIGRFDPAGQYDWDEPDSDDDLNILDTEANLDMAQEVRDTLKFGASVVFDTDTQMSNTWAIPGSTLGFVIMGGGSYGDDPFDGYSAVVMFIESLNVWTGLRGLTNVICGGLPHIDYAQNHRKEETDGRAH
jgi:hypothetical protein